MLKEHGQEEGSDEFISSSKLDAVADHLVSLAKWGPYAVCQLWLVLHVELIAHETSVSVVHQPHLLSACPCCVLGWGIRA